MATVQITANQLLGALKALQVSPAEPTMGICGNLDYKLASELGAKMTDYFILEEDLGISTYQWVGETSQLWPKWSGHYVMPVPTPSLEGWVLTHKWEGEYGELRRELLQFLIEELENGSYA